jgi:hypothetical protein
MKVAAAFLPCVVYLVLFFVLVASYFHLQQDQLIYLTIIGMPLSVGLLAVASKDMTALAQIVTLGALGLIQYGVLALLILRRLRGSGQK